MINKIKQWLHDRLGWGFPSDEYVMGNSICLFCKGRLDTDSTGASFHLPRSSPPEQEAMIELKPVAAHRDGDNRCLNCREHGAPFDGPCDGCGYSDPRWGPDSVMLAFDQHNASSRANNAQDGGK